MTANLYTLSVPIKCQKEEKTEDGFPMYNSRIASTNLTSYYTRINTKVLRGFAKNARDGVMVLANHNRGQIVGRSLSGTYTDQDEVMSKFYIQPGLEFAGAPAFGSSGYKTTDDYINAIDGGTYTDISVGFDDYREECDYCGEEVKYSFFYAGCKNGHLPGMKIYVDDDGTEYTEPGKGRTEIQITGTITEGNLFEYSLVDIGALPGAEIIKQAELAKIGAHQKSYLYSRYGINLDAPDQIKEKMFRFVEPIQLLPEGKDYSFPTYGDVNMDPVTQVSQDTVAALQAENVRLAEENRELQSQSATYQQGQLSLTEKEEELKTANEKIAELEATNSVNETKLSEYNAELSRLKDYAFSEYTRAKGGSPDRAGFDEIAQSLESIHAVRKLANEFKIQGDLRLNRYASSQYQPAPYVPRIDQSEFDPQDYY